MQRDDPENALLYRKLEVHIPSKHPAGPSKGEELKVQYRFFVRFVWWSKSYILLRPDLPAKGRQVPGQITDQVIEFKQVCQDDIGIQEPDPFCRCRFGCLFQLPIEFTVRGPVDHKGRLVSIDTDVKWNSGDRVLISLFLYAFLMEALGFILVTLFLFLYLLGVIERRKIGMTVLISVLVTSFAYLIFELALESQLPKGIFFRF